MADYDLSDADLEQMYQEVILEASKHPHGKASFAPDITSADAEEGEASADQASVKKTIGDQAGRDSQSVLTGSSTQSVHHDYCLTGQSHQFNPTCGDEVTIRLELTDGSDGQPIRIRKLEWDGQGCSISQASLSIMYDLLQGKTMDQALQLDKTFHQLMNSRGKGLDDEAEADSLEDAIVFQGASQYPMRIKCALLGWEGFKDSAAAALAQQGKTAG